MRNVPADRVFHDSKYSIVKVPKVLKIGADWDSEEHGGGKG